MAVEEAQPLARPRTDWSKVVTGGLVAFLAAVLLYQGIGEARKMGLVKVGEAAPPVVGTVLGGEPFDLSALRGKAVIVDFWATWCDPCREELPTLVKLAREYRDRGLVVVLADQAVSDRPAAVGIFTNRLMPDHPDNVHVVLAAEESLDQYKVRALPTTYFLDREGRIVDRYQGLTGEGTLRDAIEQALRP
ncbi:MAG TPA: TlpA disulfide reductase family protein [Myxococcaceae bacterium]|nr:TlpA disulfide reductase family protein [Myxococcaceae bacterium]